MNRAIELKHVGPKDQVRALIEDLFDRLEEKLRCFSSTALSAHALFDENGTHKLYRIALSCHLPPGHMAAAHEEGRESGTIIRKAFAELERQIDKHLSIIRHQRQRRHLARKSVPVPEMEQDLA